MTACAADPSSAPSGSPSDTPSEAASPSPSGSASGSRATAAITIDTPAEGTTLSVPFAASGTADVFEAALTIDAVDESGMTACVRHLMATSGSGTRGTWEGTLAFPPEEDPLRVTFRAYTMSPEDGSMANLVEFPVTISPERPMIIMTSPRCGDRYDAGGLVMLTGTAALFEAAFTVELRDAAEHVILTVPITAAECCVESQFSAQLTLPSDMLPGFYDVAAYSIGAKDGSVENEFIVQIEVRG
ncbi:Gmad2 immunoglobulin-like domain-containing protein [Microbacterium sp. SS28]|uniref:Gmad2 immunoglobulin-like domain-containing protein n=1 Tax=Microbacterium sp. SS28 TaxID=2919948 RepID=UPI001FAA20D5|nr:Gmad2 immunoglobulin-like domain-containing protein [Microbacterium sp. SS28]